MVAEAVEVGLVLNVLDEEGENRTNKLNHIASAPVHIRDFRTCHRRLEGGHQTNTQKARFPDGPARNSARNRQYRSPTCITEGRCRPCCRAELSCPQRTS